MGLRCPKALSLDHGIKNPPEDRHAATQTVGSVTSMHFLPRSKLEKGAGHTEARCICSVTHTRTHSLNTCMCPCDTRTWNRLTCVCVHTNMHAPAQTQTDFHAHQPVRSSCQQASCLPVSPSVHRLETPLTTRTHAHTHTAILVKLALGVSLPALCQGVWQEEF